MSRPSETPVQVEPLSPYRVQQAGEVLARAFQDDPLMDYILPSATERERVLPEFLGATVRYGLLAGEVLTAGPDVRGVAVSLPPRRWSFPLVALVRSGMLRVPGMLGQERFARLAECSVLSEAIRRRHVPGPHWYLWVLGVDPEHQGTGVGGMLLRRVIAQAEGRGVPLYLETLKETNVEFYRRHGLQVVEERRTQRGGLTVWGMARYPENAPRRRNGR